MHIPGFGVVLTLAVLLSIGCHGQQFCGPQVGVWGDALITAYQWYARFTPASSRCRTPVFSDSGNAFRTAVLVQWPREGVWTVAFVTGNPAGEMASYLRDEFVSVFVPTTPNPTGGYFRAGAQE